MGLKEAGWHVPPDRVVENESCSLSERVSVAEARKRLSSSDALVVCAYEDQDKCEKIRLAGALTYNELKAMETSLSTARELIFYCG